jgi:hypothetical protein
LPQPYIEFLIMNVRQHKTNMIETINIVQIYTV